MASKPGRSTLNHAPRQQRRRRRSALTILWSLMCECWRAFQSILRGVLACPPVVRFTVITSLLLFLWLGLNWAYQTFHKPTELLFPFDQSFHKSPIETWKEYEPLFREHSTAIITPEFLAALAQVEGSGNPVARTYWRWQLTWNVFEMYQPASSAVGMFQITDGTFEEARRYCIQNHVVVEDGPWNDWNSCWFNSLYTRIVPSHAIELTAAFLDRRVTEIIGPRRVKGVGLKQKQNLAAVLHLCGAGASRAYAARGFRLTPNQRCGDHDVRAYLSRIKNLNHIFAKAAAGDNTIQQAP